MTLHPSDLQRLDRIQVELARARRSDRPLEGSAQRLAASIHRFIGRCPSGRTAYAFVF